MDYTELVKSLREATGWKNASKHYSLMGKAADAIEELLPFKKQVEKGMGLLDKADELLNVIKPRWISVAERVPDENDDVLIYGEWTGVSGTKYREVWLTDLKEFLHQGYKPIAWMPLPEPPKEETE